MVQQSSDISYIVIPSRKPYAADRAGYGAIRRYIGYDIYKIEGHECYGENVALHASWCGYTRTNEGIADFLKNLD